MPDLGAQHSACYPRWIGLGPAPHGDVRLPPTNLWMYTYGAVVVGSWLGLLGCQRQPTPSETTASASAVDESAGLVLTAASAVATTSDMTSAAGASVAPTWAVGVWRGEGTASAVKLELPGNQGVQLAWVQDKGTKYVGPVAINLAVRRDGSLAGDVSGSFGAMHISGNWDGTGALHGQLVASSQTPDAFSGMLTIAFTAPTSTASASLRVVSNDGHWVRQATVALGLVKK